ncbi:MAG: hypothetical protein H6R11_879 [Proteobacteria bacterium]|jgi:hypothetical protein|nr:hypothetical protein [Pseudomonadota bacterium]
MGTLIAAFAAFVLSALYLLPLPPDLLPAAFAPYRDAVFMALSLYVVVAILIGRQRKPKAEPRREPEPRTEPVAPPKEEPPQVGEALLFLSLLQDKGRFVDFLMEDITAYNDAQVAAASRVVHQGCSAVIKEYLAISPVHEGKEGDRITIERSSDPNRYRLVGKVLGEPPFNGVVIHRGWQTSRLALPRFTRPVDPSGRNTITPAEVEVR